MIVPGVPSDTTQVVALVALFAAALTYFEYASPYPCLVEFRDAPPFNRVRFMSLFLTVVLLSLVCKGRTEPTTLTYFVEILGQKVGAAFDFPFSPVQIMTKMLPEGVDPARLAFVQMAGGVAYLVSLLTLAIFVILMRTLGWPSREGMFNVWVNLPTFDPTTGGDVVRRLNRDAVFNIVMGFLLPFLIPLVVMTASLSLSPVTLEDDQTLIWTMTAWAFLPASLFMRGIAMGRVAGMIAARRRMSNARDEAGLQPA
ncbi:hypothetical protein [Ostreiculturibacter nitratireducens]|uniref:hypothetical protein n=1 Tax=Ostreiculturibacter nitratireducens TaxID=3075226 RepID=UPI0031B5D51A